MAPAIILFSGLGSIEEAQETLSVGVGALAGSTIMLLTVPWALSVYGGRVDLVEGKPTYKAKPKLTEKDSVKEEMEETGVAITNEVSHAGIVMAVTTIPYFLIQVPALFMHGPTEEIAKGEHWWSLAGFLICLAGLIYYMRLQLHFSQEGQDKDKRVAVTKKILQEGKLSLSGAVQNAIEFEEGTDASKVGEEEILTGSDSGPSPKIRSFLGEILREGFSVYDRDNSGQLELAEVRLFFRDFHENVEDREIQMLLKKYDVDSDESLSFDDFISLAYHLIKSRNEMENTGHRKSMMTGTAQRGVVDGIFDEDGGDEKEEIPEDFTDLSPEEQQVAIKWRSFKMLFIGTVLVIYFSDPMVDVMQEIAVRTSLPPFYVSFVLAPLASNASEVVASMYYASKKTRKTMSVSLSALEGAASMNNTFW